MKVMNNKEYKENSGNFESKEYKIYILLSRFKDIFSKITSFVSAGGCSHVSIGLSENTNLFYSFTIKGFAVEHPHHWKRAVNKVICYEIPVSREQYDKVKEKIQYMLKHRSEYHYSRIGVALCFLRIPNKIRRRYICSQFVSELLVETDIVKVPMSPSICLPETVGHFVKKSGRASEVCRFPAPKRIKAGAVTA